MRYLVLAYDALGREVEIDVRTETRRALREMGVGSAAKVEVQLRRTRQRDARWEGGAMMSGHAYPARWPSGLIAYAVQDGRPQAERLLELVYHEAAHVADWEQNDRERSHGEAFQRTLADALAGRWPFLRYGSVRRWSAYEADERIVEQMQEYVRAGGQL